MSVPGPIHGHARSRLDAMLGGDACCSDASDSSWANVSDATAGSDERRASTRPVTDGKPVEPDSGRMSMGDALTSGEARKLTRAEAQWLDQARKRLLHAPRRSTRPVERRRDQ